MSLEILGVASQSPSHTLSQEQIARFATPLCATTSEQARLLSALYRRTRIRRRSSVLLEESAGKVEYRFYPLPTEENDKGPSTEERMEQYERSAAELAIGAAQKALDRASVRPAEIGHLITVSCTGFSAPGLDYHLIRRLQLPPGTQRAHIGFMGCHAGWNALRVASALSNLSGAKVLIAAVELCTLHFQYGWVPDQLVSNSLFADGAGAIVAAPGVPGNARWKLDGNGSFLLPDSEDAMTWRIGNHGFHMTLSAAVPDLIEAHLAAWLDPWLETFHVRREEIRSWAVHPGGPRILSSTERALGLSSEATRISREVLQEHGNMSSATLFFILERLVQDKAPLPCVALGFGPGLTIESALFQ